MDSLQAIKQMVVQDVTSPNLVMLPPKPVLVENKPRCAPKALQELINLLQETKHSAFNKH